MTMGISIDQDKIDYWNKIGEIVDDILEKKAKKLGCSKYVLSLNLGKMPEYKKERLIARKMAQNAKEHLNNLITKGLTG